MPRQLTYQNFEFAGIPMSGSVDTHPLDETVYRAEVGSVIIDQKGQRHQFFGYSAKPEPQIATHVACCEVLERMLATRQFHSGTTLRNGFWGLEIFSGSDLEPANPRDVLIRENVKNLEMKPSASGLGLHLNWNEAIEHAIREILERHLLMSIWYEGLDIFPIGPVEYLPHGYELQVFGISNEIPFSIAIISNPNIEVFFSGSAVGKNFSTAITKSRSEALHQSSNYLEREWPPTEGNHQDSIDRVRDLVGAPALLRHLHIASRFSLQKLSVSTEDFDARTVLKKLLPETKEAYAYRLGEWEQFKAVRVIIPNALTKNQARAKHHLYDCPPDPFC